MEEPHESENEIFEPIWEEGKIRELYPPLDFQEGKAFIGIWLRGRGKEGMVFKPCIITSKQEWFELKNSELEAEGFYTTSPLMQLIPQRWSLNSIQEFLTGKAKKIDPVELHKKIEKVFRQYIDFNDDDNYSFFATWVMGTYLYQLFDAFPYIYLNAPKGSGKTRLLTLLSLLAFNAELVVSVSTSTLFRIVESSGSTLCIDESEKLSKREETEFRSILLSGYKKGCHVTRAEEKRVHGVKEYVVRKFKVYSPKVIANITGLDDIVESRCITFIMRRSRKKEIANRELNQNDPVFQEIRDELYLYTMQQWENVKNLLGCDGWEMRVKTKPSVVNSEMVSNGQSVDVLDSNNDINPILSHPSHPISTSSHPDDYTRDSCSEGVFLPHPSHPSHPESEKSQNEIQNRDLELWRPVLIIAKSLSPELYGKMYNLMQRKVSEVECERGVEDLESNILYALDSLVVGDAMNCPLKDIVSELKVRMELKEESPFPSNRQVSRLLKSLGFTQKSRTHGRVTIMIEKKQVRDIMGRFNLPLEGEKEEPPKELGQNVLAKPKPPEYPEAKKGMKYDTYLNCEYCGELKNCTKWRGRYICENCYGEESQLVSDEGVLD